MISCRGSSPRRRSRVVARKKGTEQLRDMCTAKPSNSANARATQGDAEAMAALAAGLMRAVMQATRGEIIRVAVTQQRQRPRPIGVRLNPNDLARPPSDRRLRQRRRCC
jgi:hypothetical protein